MSPRARRFAPILFGVLASILVPVAANAQPGVPPVPTDPALAMPPPPAMPPSDLPPSTGPVDAPPMPPPAMAAPMAPGPKPTAVAPLKIENPNATIRLGLLAQPQYEAVGATGLNSNTQNLYLRRIRILVGGTVFKDFEYFFDTDYPNLFKTGAPVTSATGVVTLPKNSPGMNIQDAFGTYKAYGDMFKLDVGFMLPPLAHNAVQGAATLYGWDYFANSFLSGNSFGNAAPSPVGRDLGVQARGLVVDGHLEYRVGVFQGLRNRASTTEVGGRNSFRVVGRLQINLLDPETGFFYAGTYLGAKRILSVGGSYDFQNGPTGTGSYSYWAADAVLDLPAGPGVVTAQVNVARWNISNGTFIDLPKQTAVMAEAGYNIQAIHLSPIVRYERHSFSAANTITESRYVGGLALWCYGHNSNLKAFYSRIHDSPLPAADHDFNQFNLQWQLYFY